MLNKYTLNFLYQEQTDNYIKKNSPKIIEEHLNFTIYALAFAVVCVIQFLLAASYTLAILASLSILLILFLQKLLSKKPQYINYMITFYHFYVLFVVSINLFLPSERPSRNFQWSYGFQMCFMHFCLYLQATNMIWSTIVMFIIMTLHFCTFSYDPELTYTHLINFIFTFICMVAVKYNYEKRKKEEFFYSYQQEQWDWIIRKSISNTIILIRYDDKQDQLRLVKQSTKSQQLNNIQNCYDLRQFLRKLQQINIAQSIKHIQNGKNLEQIIRQMLIFKNEKYTLKPFEKKFVIDLENKTIYKVKLNKFILDNELQCLLILDKKQISGIQSQEMQRKLLNELTGNVASQIKQVVAGKIFFKIQKQQANALTKIKENCYIQTTLFFIQIIMKSVVPLKQSIINYVTLMAQLNQVFKDLCKLEMDLQFIQDQRYIISIILTICKLIEFVNGYLPKFQIKIFENHKNQIEMSIQFAISSLQHNEAIYQLLQANWVGSKQFTSQQQYEHCIERLCVLIEQYNLPMLILFDICAMQVVLSQISLFNHLKVMQNIQFLEFKCFFQNNELV